MSLGFSVSDAVLFGQLAWKTLQNSRKACGQHDELTREVSSLHVVIHRLEKEVSYPESPINRPGDRCKEELQAIVGGCETVLKLLNRILEKYNTLSEKERSVKKLWQRVRFGNGELADIRDLREKLTYYTSALSLFVNMVSMGSIGRVEQKMETAGGDIREIRIAVNGITAHLLSATNREGSVLTTYADDDKAVWKEFRKELIGEGFSSAIIRKHKRLIKAYIKELGDRGLLDDEDPHDANGLSGWADTRTDDLASAFSELKNISKSTCINTSKVEVGIPANDQFKAMRNRVEPSPSDASITCSYPDAVLTARSHGTRLLKSFSKECQVDPAGCKEIMFSSYGYGETPYRNSKRFVIQYKDFNFSECLSRSVYTESPVWSQRFQARVQVLLECQPHIWIFRARKDIDKVHILVERKTRIGEDWELVVDHFQRALMLLASFYDYGSSSRGMVWTLSALGPIYEFDKLSFIKLEEFMYSEWWFKIQGETRGSRLRHDLHFRLSIAKWVRQFDIEIGATAARITNAWAKAAEIVQYNYNGMRSLALSFTEGISGSESPAQSHEQIDNLHSAMPRSSAPSTSSSYSSVFDDGGTCKVAYGNRVHARTQGIVEDLDGIFSPLGSDQDGPYHPNYCDTADPSPSKAQDNISANNNPLGTIWRENYIGTLLPQCENFIWNPPSFPGPLRSEYDLLSLHMLSQVVMRLDAVDLQGDYALSKQRRKLVYQAEEMLDRLDEVIDWFDSNKEFLQTL